MRRRRPLIEYLEYIGVRLIVGICPGVDGRAVVCLRPAAGAVSYRVDPQAPRGRLSRTSDRRSATATPRPSATTSCAGSTCHFCMMLMEILHIPRKLHPTTWRDRITLVGPRDQSLDRLMTGGPLIMLTGHFGNWEMAGYLFGVFGFPPHSVARTLDNPYLDRFLRSFRERTGQKLIPKKGGYDQMLDVLRTRRRPVVPGRPGRRPARPVRRVLRPAGLDAQGDRAPGHRAPCTGRRRLRPADRAGLPLRGRLRRDHRARRVDRHPRRRPPAHPALHDGPGSASSAAIPSSTSGSTAAGSISRKCGSGSRRPRRQRIALNIDGATRSRRDQSWT